MHNTLKTFCRSNESMLMKLIVKAVSVSTETKKQQLAWNGLCLLILLQIGRTVWSDL